MMGYVLRFAIGNWKGLAVGAILAAVAAYQIGHWMGYRAGEKAERAVHAAAARQDADKKVTIREKQNEIRNRDPGDADSIKRMQQHTF